MNLAKYKIKMLALLLAITIAGTSFPVFAKKNEQAPENTTAATEAGEPETSTGTDKIYDHLEAEFTWDDDTKDDALTVWQFTDWSEFQNKLILDVHIGTHANADVSDEVRALEPDIRRVLTAADYVTPAESEMEDYVELMLAMIQILAEDCGIFEDGSGANIQSWIDSMGYCVDPNFDKGLLDTEAKDRSIRALFDAYMTACQAFKTKKREGITDAVAESGDVCEPYLFPTEESDIVDLQTVLEGVVMKNATAPENTYTYFYTGSDGGAYSKDSARYFSDTYAVPSYFADIPEGNGYSPSPNFAKRVMDIYTVSKGMISAAATAGNNATVNAFITELEKYEGLPYIWGGKSPSDGGFDCAGLISYCLTQIGYLDGYRNSDGLKSYLESHATEVTTENLSPGDILWHPGHVAVYISDGMCFEAQQSGTKIGYFKTNTDVPGSRFDKAYHWS